MIFLFLCGVVFKGRQEIQCGGQRRWGLILNDSSLGGEVEEFRSYVCVNVGRIRSGGDIEDEDKDGGKDGVQLMIRE